MITYNNNIKLILQKVHCMHKPRKLSKLALKKDVQDEDRDFMIMSIKVILNSILAK